MPRMIWLASVDHEHGMTLYAATTEPGIWAVLAAFCTQWWVQDGPDRPIEELAGLTDQEIVEAYFEWQASIGGSESYTIQEAALTDTGDA